MLSLVRLQWRLLAFQLNSVRFCRMFTKKVPDGVIGAQTDPVRDGAVLLHLLSKDTLGFEGLEGRLIYLVSDSISKCGYST